MRAKIDNDWSVYQEDDGIYVVKKKKDITKKIGTAGRELNRKELLQAVESYLVINSLCKE